MEEHFLFIKELIGNYLPTDMVQCEYHTESMEVILVDRGANITVLRDSKWIDIKRRIDKIVNTKIEKICSICSENKTIVHRISCTKCSADWCIDCYINIFRTNKGIIKCPFCRYSYGHEMPEILIDAGVAQIMNKFYNIDI